MRLRAERVTCLRGERLVLDRVGFAVPAGGALLLLGPNGAGKSTLLRVLAGLARLDGGSVTLDGTPDYAGRVAYLGHQDAIKPGLSVLENVRFAARIGGGDARGALATVGLEGLAELPARMLSAGQKRRLALARLTLLDAPLWLLDEPTVGLDAAAVARLGEMLAAQLGAGGVVVAATHLPLPLPSARLELKGWERRDPGGLPYAIDPAQAQDPKVDDEPRQNGDGGSGGGGPPPPAFLRGSAALLARELNLALRHGGDTASALLFFFVAGALFPFGIGPAPQILSRIAPGIVWVCALLAALLPLERLFGADLDDGSLDQLLVTNVPAGVIALAKSVAHWLVTGLPLLIAATPLAIMLQVKPAALPVLLAGLSAGTMILSLVGSACGALVLGARRGAILLPVLTLPLALPVLIFGTAAADAAATGAPSRPPLLLLAAILAACLPLCPLAAGAALRAAVD